MASFTVTGPDGKEWDVDVPNGASQQDAIDEVARLHYSGGGQSQDNALVRGIASIGRAFLGDDDAPASTLNSVSRGMLDTPVAAAQLATNTFGSPETAQRANDSIADDEVAYQNRRGPNAGVDFARLGGNMLSTAPMMATGGAPATMVRAMVQGAAQGAGAAALTPVSSGHDYWAEKGRQLAMGAVTGGVATPVMAGLSRMISGVADPAVKFLADKGIRLTPGQMLGETASNIEQRLTGVVPFVGGARGRTIDDFNRAAYQEALNPISAQAPQAVGRAGVRQARQAVSQAYDDVLARVQFVADNQFGQEVSNLSQMAQNLPPQQANEFARVLRDKVMSRLGQTGQIDGITYKGIESELGQISRSAMRSDSYSTREFGNAVGSLQQSLRSGLERANPQAAEQLAAVNRSFAMLSDLRRAAASPGARNGRFTPRQLIGAIARGDQSRNRTVFSEGGHSLQRLAETADSVIGNSIPNSGTPERLITQIGATGGLGYVNPVAGAAVGGASLLYTRPGQRLAQSLMLGQRGPIANGVSDFLRRGSAVAGPLAGLAVAQR